MKKSRIATLLVLTSLTLAACSADDQGGTEATDNSQPATSESSAAAEAPAADITIADGSDTGTDVPGEGTLVMRQLYTAPHGTRSFAAVNVIMNGDTIVSSRLDEFQYLDPAGFTGVPNSDGGFGESYPEGVVLASKEVNDEAYSAMMAENAGATQSWQESIDAITDFTKGKTVAELEEALGELDALGEEGNPADVVSGATFSDTQGYLQSIVDTAKNGAVSIGAETNTTELAEAQVLGAPHGDKSFAITTVALDGDTVVAAFLDEFQYVDAADFGGVPSSDADFGEGVAEGQVLASKIANDEAYSAMMAERGGATKAYAENMQTIQDFAIGKTIAELEEALGELDALGEDGDPADVVSGATFSDTHGYLQAIVETAKEAQ
ncbi:peptidoglycan-binding protein [Enterococcus olivae]